MKRGLRVKNCNKTYRLIYFIITFKSSCISTIVSNVLFSLRILNLNKKVFYFNCIRSFPLQGEKCSDSLNTTNVHLSCKLSAKCNIILFPSQQVKGDTMLRYF